MAVEQTSDFPGTVEPESASTVDVACEAIREAIRSGRFAGGDRIREVEVCELAKVSRTSVRHALTLLAAEGYVELRPNRGAVVIDWTDENLLEIFDLRAMLEGYGASRTCATKLSISPGWCATRTRSMRAWLPSPTTACTG
jgi:DNA-binding GntR family transcriptional regulator